LQRALHGITHLCVVNERWQFDGGAFGIIAGDETRNASIVTDDDNDRANVCAARTIMRTMIRVGFAVHAANGSARTQDDENEVNAGSSMIVMLSVIPGTLSARLANVSHAVDLIRRPYEKLHALLNTIRCS